MITDEHRGLALELSLTKLLHMDKANLQIIGMSATIGVTAPTHTRHNLRAVSQHDRRKHMKIHMCTSRCKDCHHYYAT